jgi:hypothetical protein
MKSVLSSVLMIIICVDDNNDGLLGVFLQMEDNIGVIWLDDNIN